VYSDEKGISPSITANLAITMPRTALITGGTGLLGRAVVKAFENAGWEVTGTGFSRASPPDTIKLNVLDEAEVSRVLDEVK
jgi:S-adenosylmethionine synthetase